MRRCLLSNHVKPRIWFLPEPTYWPNSKSMKLQNHSCSHSKSSQMHRYDFNLIACLHFSKPTLPIDVRIIIYNLTFDSRKLGRKAQQNKPFTGTSKCAARRRAKRYGRCFDCGALLEANHVCKLFTTRSSSDCLSVIHEGPAKLYAERNFRKSSFAEQLILNDLELMKLYE
uniref:NBP n=1 Tax=Garlic virus X TaxID=150284 RepID=A0A6M2YYW3_9VIRU|nr:NBP [Garlic virus X]